MVTQESFLKDVSRHTLRVMLNDELQRHLVLSNGISWNQRFEIVTWPGYLAYAGDMGSFLFHRLEDMFQFFRLNLASRRQNRPRLSFIST